MPKYQGVMTTKRYRKVNKSKETTYEDIKDLAFNPMEQYGFGSWLKNNSSTIGKVATIAGTVLTATGIGAGVGAGLMAAGAAATAYGNKVDTEKAQNEQAAATAAIEHQQMINNKTQELNSVDNPLYSGVMRRGGKIRKMEMVEITTTKVIVVQNLLALITYLIVIELYKRNLESIKVF